MFDYDATVIRKLRDAGAILVAKLSMVELAGSFGYSGADASFTGPGRNPWNLDYWAGGSSSGPGTRGGRRPGPLRHWLGDVRLDHHAGGLLRHRGIAADLWPRQPTWSHGPELDA